MQRKNEQPSFGLLVHYLLEDHCRRSSKVTSNLDRRGQAIRVTELSSIPKKINTVDGNSYLDG